MPKLQKDSFGKPLTPDKSKLRPVRFVSCLCPHHTSHPKHTWCPCNGNVALLIEQLDTAQEKIKRLESALENLLKGIEYSSMETLNGKHSREMPDDPDRAFVFGAHIFFKLIGDSYPKAKEALGGEKSPTRESEGKEGKKKLCPFCGNIPLADQWKEQAEKLEKALEDAMLTSDNRKMFFTNEWKKILSDFREFKVRQNEETKEMFLVQKKISP